MTNTELAEVVRSTNMYELASKTVHNIILDENEKEVAARLDEHFRNVGKTGKDTDKEIAAFIQRVIEEEFYNTPDDIIDMMFDRNNIGEFDSGEIAVTGKNGLVAHEAAKGGSVERSFLDISVVTPKWVNLQVDTEISYQDLARNGWKTVARITEYAIKALESKRFAQILDTLDNGIASGAPNYITGSTTVTQAAADELALYVNDRAEIGNGLIIGKSAYIQQMSKLSGFASDAMKDEVHRNGFLGEYDGIPMRPVSAAKTLADGTLLIPDKRVFGIAGKIGALDQKGEVHVYQDENHSKEVVNIWIKDFTYGIALYKDSLENVAKIVLS